jgi:hypothetical protein
LPLIDSAKEQVGDESRNRRTSRRVLPSRSKKEGAMASRKEELSQDETGRLISADKVQGTAVENPAGDSLGTIEALMIDKPSGKVAYAVMSFGGILGMGKDRRALPWEILTYDTGRRAYVLDLDPAVLRGALAFEDTADGDDHAWGQQVHDYYRVKPYWTLPPAG